MELIYIYEEWFNVKEFEHLSLLIFVYYFILLFYAILFTLSCSTY